MALMRKADKKARDEYLVDKNFKSFAPKSAKGNNLRPSCWQGQKISKSVNKKGKRMMKMIMKYDGVIQP